MPTGISAGARSTRARRSASTRKIAPTSTEAGSSRRWSGPKRSRATWGTTRPMKPTSPLTDTAAAVNSEPTMSRASLRRSTSTPRWAACSSPSRKALRSLARKKANTIPTSARGVTTLICDQPLAATPPMVHSTTWYRARVPASIRKDMTAAIIELRAKPARSRVVTEVRGPTRATR